MLICYRINIFWIRAAALIWVNTIFKFNRFNMYQYNCIFFWASREEKQLFCTPVRLDFLTSLLLPSLPQKTKKKSPASASCSRTILSSLDSWASLPWDECNWSTGLWVILCLNEILCLNGSYSSNNFGQWADKHVLISRWDYKSLHKQYLPILPSNSCLVKE